MPHHAELPLWDDKSDAQKIETLQQMVTDLYEVTFAQARQNLADILNNAISLDQKENTDINQMLTMLHTYPNIMSPNCEMGHFTGSALVCDEDGRVLLHFHKKLKRWLQFGGHADTETDFAQVALREATEETGLIDLVHFSDSKNPIPIDFDIHTIPASKNRPEHLHLDLRYVLQTKTPHSLNPPEGESNQFKWATPAEFLEHDADLFDPALQRLLLKAQNLIISQM